MFAKIKDAKQKKKAEFLANVMTAGKKVEKIATKVVADTADDACKDACKKMDLGDECPETVACTAAEKKRQRMLLSKSFDTEVLADPEVVDTTAATKALIDAGLAPVKEEVKAEEELGTVDGVDTADITELETEATTLIAAEKETTTKETAVTEAEKEETAAVQEESEAEKEETEAVKEETAAVEEESEAAEEETTAAEEEEEASSLDKLMESAEDMFNDVFESAASSVATLALIVLGVLYLAA